MLENTPGSATEEIFNVTVYFSNVPTFMHLPLNIARSETHLCPLSPNENLLAACEDVLGLTQPFSGAIGTVGGTGSSDRG